MSGPWTVSCFVKREGRWVRLWRVVDSLPIPLPDDLHSVGLSQKAAERARAVVHELLGVTDGEPVQGECITPGDSAHPLWRHVP